MGSSVPRSLMHSWVSGEPATRMRARRVRERVPEPGRVCTCLPPRSARTETCGQYPAHSPGPPPAPTPTCGSRTAVASCRRRAGTSRSAHAPWSRSAACSAWTWDTCAPCASSSGESGCRGFLEAGPGRCLPSRTHVLVGGPHDAAPQQAGQGAPKLFPLPSGRWWPGLLEGAALSLMGDRAAAQQHGQVCSPGRQAPPPLPPREGAALRPAWRKQARLSHMTGGDARPRATFQHFTEWPLRPSTWPDRRVVTAWDAPPREPPRLLEEGPRRGSLGASSSGFKF